MHVFSAPYHSMNAVDPNMNPDRKLEDALLISRFPAPSVLSGPAIRMEGTRRELFRKLSINPFVCLTANRHFRHVFLLP